MINVQNCDTKTLKEAQNCDTKTLKKTQNCDTKTLKENTKTRKHRKKCRDLFTIL